MSQLFTNQQWLPSPLPGKSAWLAREMVPAPRSTTGSLPRMDSMGTTYMMPIFTFVLVNNGGLNTTHPICTPWIQKYIGDSCNSYKFLQIIHNSYKFLQIIHNIPGSVLPSHSSKTSTNAQLNFLMPLSVSASIENKSKTLQNQRLSMLSTKLPRAAPGGRMKTRSCRFNPCNRLLANGNDEMRCSPEYFLWPIKRVLKR